MDNPNQKNGQNPQQNQIKSNTPKPMPPAQKPMPRMTPPPPTGSPVMQVVAAFIVGVLVGVIGYSIATRHLNSTVATDTDTTSMNDENASDTPSTINTSGSSATASVSNALGSTDNDVIIHDQPAGKSVHVAQVDFKDGGWVAIQENVNGVPGKILGAAYFGPGQSLDGTIPLVRATVAGTSYLAVMHFDIGTGPRTFDYKTDVAMDDSSGHPIASSFTAQ